MQGIKLLLVEDNLINQKVARRLLEGQGFAPAVANNGREALDHLTRSRADIILMDMQMPEMDGYEATRQIRSLEQHERPPLSARQPVIIVALTANAMKGDRERCLKAGMDDYLTKPVLLPALKDCLQKWTAVVQERKSSPIPPAAPPPQPSRTSPPPKLPQSNDMIDWERVREFTNDDPAETAELFRFYHEQTLEVMAKLRRAVDAASVEDVRRLAHTAAGASASVGLLRLTDEFRDLEHKARAGSIEGARDHLDRLDALLAQFYAVAFAPH